MQTQIFFQNILAELKLLLNAPFMEPSMTWIILPLLTTFLIMTFYFGIYKKEELGWNTALANMIVLAFIIIDLTKHIYYYAPYPSIQNFLLHPIKTAVIALILAESIIFMYSALAHVLPKKILFFVTSPLSLILQAYIATSIIYLKKTPTKYTLMAALVMFLILFITSRILQKTQRSIIRNKHKRKLAKAKKLYKQAKDLKKRSKKIKGKTKDKIKRSIQRKIKKAKKLENQVMAAELLQSGRIITIKKVTKKRKKRKKASYKLT